MKPILLLWFTLCSYAMADVPMYLEHNHIKYAIEQQEWQEALAISRGLVLAEDSLGQHSSTAQLKAQQHARAIQEIKRTKARLIVLNSHGVIPDVYSYSEISQLGEDRSGFSPGHLSYGPQKMADSLFISYFLSAKENQLKRRFQQSISADTMAKYYRVHKLRLFPPNYDYVLSYVDVDEATSVTEAKANFDSYNTRGIELLVKHRKSDAIPWGSALEQLPRLQEGQFGLITNDYFSKRLFRLERKRLIPMLTLDEAAPYLKRVIAKAMLAEQIDRVYSQISSL